MIRIFREHPNFDEYTKFDSDIGKLEHIGEAEYQSFLPDGFREEPGTAPASGMDHSDVGDSRRVEAKGATIFTGRTFETNTRFPRRIYFQITRFCNLKCPACFIRAGRNGAHVPTEAMLDVAEYMGKNGLIEARLSGGEPTTHPDFFRIMHGFKEAGVYVSVATNGVMDRRTLDALCEENNLWLICSIDGNREIHDKYRGETFDRIMQNLSYLKERNPSTRLRLTTVLTRENMGQMRELGLICKGLSAESLTVIPLRPQVRDPEMIDKMVTANDFKRVIEDLVKVSEEIGIRFSTTIETDYKDKIYKDPIFRKRFACAAGREGANLDYDAERHEFVVYGCSYSPAVELRAEPAIRKPFLAGTFTRDDLSGFERIWRDDSRWVIFRDSSLKSADCLGCRYLENGSCVGSCPIQNLDFAAIKASEDVLDQLRLQIHDTSEWYCYQKILGKLQ